MVILGQDWLDVRRERGEVTLIENRLNELFIVAYQKEKNVSKKNPPLVNGGG